MKNRQYPVVLGLVGLFVSFSVCLNVARTEPPNVLVILIDDMGWGDFSCFGNTELETQHIDQMAAEGIRFEQFYVNSPICSPSRTALSTGQYPQRWRISSYLASRAANQERGMAQWLDLKAPMVARFFQAAGYATGHFGKWHMGGQRDVGEAPLITEYGFDESLTNFEGLGPRVLPLCNAYDGEPLRKHALGSDRLGHGPITWEDRSNVTASFTQAALAFIQKAEKANRPFFVNLWPDDVHSPFYPPKVRRGDGAKHTLYSGVLDTMDEQFGPLFDYVRSNEKLRMNTLVLICSDNGPEPGAGSAGPFRGSKTMLFEGGVRSPLITWGPGLISADHVGKWNRDSLLAAIDIGPSLLDLCGVSVPESIQFDGESLPDVLVGKSHRSRRNPLFFRRPPDRDRFYGQDDLPDLAVRDGNWKLLCEYDGTNVKLYDLARDPGETRNLAIERPTVVKRLSELVVQWHEGLPPDNGVTYLENRAKNKRPARNKQSGAAK